MGKTHALNVLMSIGGILDNQKKDSDEACLADKVKDPEECKTSDNSDTQEKIYFKRFSWHSG